MKKYLVVYMAETDSEVQMKYMSKSEIETLEHSLSPYNFAIIDGVALKGFNDRSLPHM